MRTYISKIIRSLKKNMEYITLCYYTCRRYCLYSGVHFDVNESSQIKIIGRIIAQYHTIEKGLTMPNMKFGFGINTISGLIDNCEQYKRKYGNQKNSPINSQYMNAIKTLILYKKIHSSYKFQDGLMSKMKHLLCDYDLDVDPIKTISREAYFDKTNENFKEFSFSRHSLRNFSGQVSTEMIVKSIEIASNAPSACNRQPTRVHIVEDKATIQEILSHQRGNRGFGDLGDKLLICTAELGTYTNIVERNYPYVDGGIFIMNLLYSLHFNQIGACTLNWCYSKDEDIALRKIINIPESEEILLFILCGGVPDTFQLALSERYDVDFLYKIHKIDH